MSGHRIRTLRPNDADRLLRFEAENRGWFEQHIEPRGDAFYSQDGVRAHIAQFLDAHAHGRMHPCVIVDTEGAILGRANLKDIDRHAGTAEVGYRIAATCVGRGVATEALWHLIELALSEWQLKQLCAYVRPANAASARVLEKCGFRCEVHAAPAREVARFTLALRAP